METIAEIFDLFEEKNSGSGSKIGLISPPVSESATNLKIRVKDYREDQRFEKISLQRPNMTCLTKFYTYEKSLI